MATMTTLGPVMMTDEWIGFRTKIQIFEKLDGEGKPKAHHCCH